MQLKTLTDVYKAMEMIGDTHCMSKSTLSNEQMTIFYEAFFALRSELRPYLESEVIIGNPYLIQQEAA